MEYTIGQVAKLTGLSISTIRYYDKECYLMVSTENPELEVSMIKI